MKLLRYGLPAEKTKIICSDIQGKNWKTHYNKKEDSAESSLFYIQFNN